MVFVNKKNGILRYNLKKSELKVSLNKKNYIFAPN
jgi:hypothetical protein